MNPQETSTQNSLLTQITLSQVEELVWEELYRVPEIFVLGSEYMLSKQDSISEAEKSPIAKYPLIIRFFEEEFSEYISDWNDYKKYEERLRNTKLLYASDVFDIFSYCFPFGYRSDDDQYAAKEPSPLELLIDQQLAWQRFFEKNDVVLLDQYTPEFRGQKNRIEKTLGGHVVDEYQEIISLLKEKKLIFENLNKVNTLQKKMSIILGTLLGFSKSGVDKLIAITKNHLLVDYSPIIDKGYTHELTEHFSQNHPGADTTILYIDNREDILQSLRRNQSHNKNQKNQLKEDEERQRAANRFNSLYIDCQIIDRLLNINQSLQKPIKKNGVSERTILLLLSSTGLYEKHFSKHWLFTKKSPNDAFGRKINALRNVKQLYLQLLANSNKEANALDRFETYLWYWDVVKARETYHKNSNTFKYTDRPTFSQLTQQLRDTYEEIQIIEQYHQLHNKLTEKIKSFKETLVSNNLLETFNEIEDYIGNPNIIKSALASSNSLLRKLKISYTFQERIEYAIPRLSSKGAKISSGELDYVVGIDHHLPTVLEVRNTRYKPILEKVIGSILMPIYGREFRNEFAKFLQDIVADSVLSQKEEVQDSFTLASANSFDDNIVKYLLFLILPSPPEATNTPEIDLLWVITSDIRQLRDYLIPNAQGNQKKDFIKTLQNLRYIKAWTLRRQGKFEESLRIIDLAIETDQHELNGKDPRFFHGAALAYYCIFSQKREQQKKQDPNAPRNIAPLRRAVEEAEMALSEYNKSGILHQKHHPATRADIKAFVALVNTLINLKVLLFSYQYRSEGLEEINSELLQESRKLLNNSLKYHLNDVGSNYEDYPEYQHTEAFLEYYEARVALDKKDHLLCLTKSSSAQKALGTYWSLAKIRDDQNETKSKRSKELYNNLLNDLKALELECKHVAHSS